MYIYIPDRFQSLGNIPIFTYTILVYRIGYILIILAKTRKEIRCILGDPSKTSNSITRQHSKDNCLTLFLTLFITAILPMCGPFGFWVHPKISHLLCLHSNSQILYKIHFVMSCCTLFSSISTIFVVLSSNLPLYLIGNPLPPPTILNSHTAGPIINLYCCTLFVIDCTCNNITCV